jgi:hypothetical protein
MADMQEVELPDGTILEFPADMADRDIAAKVQDYMRMTHETPPERPQTDIGAGEGALRAGFSGATMGFGDEIVGALAAAVHPMVTPDDGSTFSERYDLYTGREREKHSEFGAARPELALPAEIGGALGTVLAAPGGAFVQGAKSTPGMIGRGAVEGAAYGGVAGAGYGDDDRMGGAIGGAGMGAFLGGGAPVVMSGGRALYNAVRGRTAANVGPAASQAEARAARAADSAGMTPGDVDARLRELGPDAVLADAMGEPGRSLARSTANVSPEARETLTSFTRGRTGSAADRIAEELLAAGGVSGVKTAQEIKNEIYTAARAEIDAAYEAARAAGEDMPMPSFIGQSDLTKRALAEGERLAKERMVAEGKTGAPSTLAVLDEAKKFLDGKAQPAVGTRQTNEQAISGGLARRMREETDALLPEYGGARQKAQTAFQREEAVDLGAEAAKGRPPADITRRIEGTPYRQEVAQGYAATKANEAESRRSTPGIVDALFGTRRQTDALDASLGPMADRVAKRIAAERAFAETDRALSGNSTTARQLIEAGATPVVGAGAGLYYGGDPQSAGAGALAALAGRAALRGGGRAIAATRAANEQKVARELARILLERNAPRSVLIPPAARSDLIKEITRLLGDTGAVGASATAP